MSSSTIQEPSSPQRDLPPRLKVQSLVKSFFGVRVLHEVSFDARSGAVLGVVGENGSGKSTTMNLLTGVLEADSGRIEVDGERFEPKSRRESDSAGIAFIQQELNVFPNLSVAENIFLLKVPRRGTFWPLISRRDMNARARALLETVNLTVSPTTLAGTLSTGERQLVEIARGLAIEARIFILDEPTSSLTAHEAVSLFEIIEHLKRQGVAVLYISHNLEDVLKLADDVLVLRDGRVTLSAPARGLKEHDLVLAMIGRPLEALFPRRKSSKEPRRNLLEVMAISEPGVLHNLTLRIGRGEIVGIAGLLGSGRSELARTIFGLDAHRAGAVWVDGERLASGDLKARFRADVAFLTEDRRRDALLMDASIAENLALAALPKYASVPGQPVDDARLSGAMQKIKERLRLKSGDIRTGVARSLSGGNQQKVILGRWLLRKPRLFILDEPTRGVDVGAKQEIYRLLAELAEGGMALLVISSEIEELIGLCDRIHVMRRGELVAELDRPAFDREAILRACLGVAAA
jgi:ABC-type sugar transport system ATPase subunit